MRLGTIPENAGKRSVNKFIDNCSDMVSAVTQTALTYPLAARIAIQQTLAAIYAKGAIPNSLSIALTLPVDAEEKDALAIMEQVSSEAQKEAVPINKVNVMTLPEANAPLMSVFACAQPSVIFTKGGKDVLLCGSIALSGTAVAARIAEDKLLKKFAPSFVNAGLDMSESLSVTKLSKIVMEKGARAMYPLAEGGILTALWRMASELNSGISVDLKAIPIRQETVEICEACGLNPYELQSVGAMLIVCENGYELQRVLAEAGFKAELIGNLTDDNDRIIRNESDVRYLDLPGEDELFKIVNNRKVDNI